MFSLDADEKWSTNESELIKKWINEKNQLHLFYYFLWWNSVANDTLSPSTVQHRSITWLLINVIFTCLWRNLFIRHLELLLNRSVLIIIIMWASFHGRISTSWSLLKEEHENDLSHNNDNNNKDMNINYVQCTITTMSTFRAVSFCSFSYFSSPGQLWLIGPWGTWRFRRMFFFWH